MPRCSHCWTHRPSLNRCPRCKDVGFCKADICLLAWNLHKKKCLPVVDVTVAVKAANARGDWRAVLEWEGRMEELVEKQTDEDTCEHIVEMFRRANVMEGTLGRRNNGMKVLRIEEKRAELFGRMGRFQNQGEALCVIGENFLSAHKSSESAIYFQRARDIGVAHGLYSVESQACQGLGAAAIMEGRDEDGVEHLRSALASSKLDSLDAEMSVLSSLIKALFKSHAIDEAEEMVLRFRAVAEAESRRRGRISGPWDSANLPTYMDLEILYASARLHEARGRPHEAEREVRALLDFLRENTASVGRFRLKCHDLLREATVNLKLLDPELGEEELVKAVAVELAQLLGA